MFSHSAANLVNPGIPPSSTLTFQRQENKSLLNQQVFVICGNNPKHVIEKSNKKIRRMFRVSTSRLIFVFWAQKYVDVETKLNFILICTFFCKY